jgi:protein-disulfide isomerase
MKSSPVCPVLLIIALAPGWGSAEEAAAPEEIVAIVDGRPIPAEALEAKIQRQLVELRLRENTLRRQALGELIAQALIESEARARGLSVAQLESAEITDKVRVSAGEADAFYEKNRSRFGNATEEEAIQQILNGLGQQRQRERRAAFAKELQGKYGVKVLLPPFRLPVEVGDAPARGNPDAPVTIVEFSDFQCPYCARARSTVNRVRKVYGDRVRLAFRHFPLDFHEQAQKAGEATACARDQDRFWEMHDRLWENPRKLEPSDLKAHAAALGLDRRRFEQCLDSGRHAALVAKDAEEGRRFGVSATPAFFINGRPLVGAQPFQAFAEVIDEELERTAGGSGAKARAR